MDYLSLSMSLIVFLKMGMLLLLGLMAKVLVVKALMMYGIKAFKAYVNGSNVKTVLA